MPQLVSVGRIGHIGGLQKALPVPDALLTEAKEEIITESGDVIIHEDTEP